MLGFKLSIEQSPRKCLRIVESVGVSGDIFGARVGGRGSEAAGYE
jgi:hypothetical protein